MRGFLLVFSLHAGPSTSTGGAWIGRDKVQHFLMSAFTQSIAYGSLRGAGVPHGLALGGASVATAAIGVGKELRDLRVKGEFSPQDLAWDAAGAGTMTLLLAHTAR